MSQPTVGRAGLELMFGSWCPGRRTAGSTGGGGGLEVILPLEGPGGGPSAENRNACRLFPGAGEGRKAQRLHLTEREGVGGPELAPWPGLGWAPYTCLSWPS